MVEIIGFEESEWREEPQAVRRGWFCFDCQDWVKAISRETVVR
jgi:hypothetical protein